MSEQENKETTQPAEKDNCCCKHKCGLWHKITGLKGLALIYKTLAALLVLYLVYILVAIWYMVLKDNTSKADALIASVQFTLTYGFYALVMLTVARALKVLKKIKHAVYHGCNK
jgi:phosphoglycerol transferase MdoB-like AlkP superfamily enzyme